MRITASRCVEHEISGYDVNDSTHSNEVSTNSESLGGFLSLPAFSCARFKKHFNPGIMPGSRCVVFGCNNTRDDKGGISIHSCPADKCLRAKWVTFVQLHRKDFFRKGSFPVCSAHFSPTAFQRAIHIKGQQRNLIKGAVPTIFKPKQTLSPISQRSRRKVSCVFILFIVFP